MKNLYKNIFILFLVFWGLNVTICIKSFGQVTTIDAVYASPSNSSGASTAPSGMTFTLENTNSGGMYLRGVDYQVMSGTYTWELWYHPTSLSGVPSAVNAANGWIQIATPQSVTASSASVIPVITNLSFVIPANTTYRFALITNHGQINYRGANMTPTSFTGAGVVLGVGDYTIGAGYVGYAGSTSTWPFRPRYFWGKVHVEPASPCTNPVTAGTSNVNTQEICAGKSIELKTIGSSFGIGLTYQWESSPTATGTYTAISPAQSASLFNYSPTQTLFYRCKVVCSNGTPVYTNPIQVVVTNNPMSGTYTVDGSMPTAGTNFNNFEDLNERLNCGIIGPVVVNVTNAVYNEKFHLADIPGASAVNTVRINGNGATLSYAASTADPFIIKLTGTQYLTLDSFIFKSSTNVGWGASLSNGCLLDSIINSTFDLSSVTATSNATANGVTITGSHNITSNGNGGKKCFIGNNVFIGNTGSGGYYHGIRINNGSDSNLVYNNKFNNFYYYGFYVSNTPGTHIVGNEFHRANKTSTTTGYGGYVINQSPGTRILNNRIHSLGGVSGSSTSTVYGIYFATGHGTQANPSLIANNVLYNFNQNGLNYGIYTNLTTDLKFYHNTIVMDKPLSTSSATYGFYANGSQARTEYRNNLVSITAGSTGTKYGYYFVNSNSVVANGLQKNNIYVNSTQPGAQYHSHFNGVDYATLALFQAAQAGMEVGSTDVDPIFATINPIDFVPTNGALLMTGENLTATVPNDIKGIARPIPPTPGAFDLLPQDMDNAGVDSLIAPDGNFCSSNQQIRVRIRNFGNNIIDTVQVHWTINGVNRPPVFNYLSIPGRANAPSNQSIVTLGTETLYFGHNYEIKVWTVDPNNKVDDYNVDDTLTITISPATTLPVSIGSDTTICDNVSYNLNAGTAQGYTYVWDNQSTAPTRFIYQAGTYYVTKTDIATGCLGVDTIQVNTVPAPSIDLGPDRAICNGDSTLLDVGVANAGNTVDWNDSSHLHQRYVSLNKTYSAVVTSPNGCFATDSITITYKDNPTIDGINSILALDGSYNFNVRNPKFIQYAIWDYSDGSANDTGLFVSHKFKNNGLYTIKVKLISECIATIDSNFVYEETLDVFDATSIDDYEEGQIAIFPNPAHDYFIVRTTNLGTIESISLYNSLGQLSLDELYKEQHKEIKINTKELSSGLYIIRLKTNNGVYLKKLELIK